MTMCWLLQATIYLFILLAVSWTQWICKRDLRKAIKSVKVILFVLYLSRDCCRGGNFPTLGGKKHVWKSTKQWNGSNMPILARNTSGEETRVWKSIATHNTETVRTITYVFPAQGGFTVFTVDVCYCVQACEEDPLLGRAAADVDTERSTARGKETGITVNPTESEQTRSGCMTLNVLRINAHFHLGGFYGWTQPYFIFNNGHTIESLFDDWYFFLR